MTFARWMTGIALGSLAGLGVVVAPASGAAERAQDHGARVTRRAPAARSLGVFTPASADPRLAAIFARGGLESGGFRFTPADGRKRDRNALTLRVAAHSNRQAVTLASASATRAALAAAPSAATTLQPIAYDMGVSVGWRRFTLNGDLSKVDLAGLPGSRQSADVGVSFTARRFSGQVRAGAERPIGNGPRLADETPAYSIDVGGSYALTRRLDVTAGVRYKAERDRLTSTPVTDDRRDSQAVYIGTAFRF